MDIGNLRDALMQVDKQTQRLLKPILHLNPVQDLLMSFLADDSKTFQEWLCEPQTVQVLERMKLMDDEQNLNKYFQDALHMNNLSSSSQENTIEKALIDAYSLKDTGKLKFKENRFEHAMRYYVKSAQCIAEFIQQHEECKTLYATCYTNAAVCAVKEKEWIHARECADKAIHVSDTLNSKAVYCKAKVYLSEQRYAEASELIEKVLEKNPLDALSVKLKQDIIKAESKEQQEIIKLSMRHKEQPKPATPEAESEEKEMDKPKKWNDVFFRFLPLPHLIGAGMMSAKINNFFSQSKLQVYVA